MRSFEHLKKELYDVVIQDPSSDSKYGKFLDNLMLDEDRTGREPAYDLWYFSDNTDFCRRSAEHFFRALEDQIAMHRVFIESLHLATRRDNHLQFDTLRRLLGSFLFYLYSALESFAHEINIFYAFRSKSP